MRGSMLAMLLSVPLLGPSIVAAQDQDVDQQEVQAGLRGCAQIEPDGLRLKCFDLLAQTVKESATDVKTADGEGDLSSSGWTVKEEKDPLTDRTRWTVAVTADPDTSMLSRGGVLAIRCVDRELDVVASWGEYLGDNTRVSIRFDEGAVVEQSWLESTGSTALFVPDEAKAWFLEQLFEAQRLILRTTPYREGPRTAVFNVAGAREALDPVRPDCPTVGRGRKAQAW